MTDQIPISDLDLLVDPRELPEGVSIEAGLTPDMMRESMKSTLVGFALEVKKIIEVHGGINIIFPFDGGFIAMYEFTKLIPKLIKPEDIAKINIIYASKNSERDGYLLSNKAFGTYPVVIMDDIYDKGGSRTKISTAAGIFRIPVVALATKYGKGHIQDNNIYTYAADEEGKDRWVASGFGMNSGNFGEHALQEALDKGLFADILYPHLIEVHKEIEIYERICGVSFIIDSENALNSWRFDPSQCLNYLRLLQRNCIYGNEDREIVVEYLRKLQERNAEEKFEIFNGDQAP